MSDKDIEKPRSEGRRPGIVLENCISIGNGGDGFRFEDVNVVGKNLIARNNEGEGIRVVRSTGDLVDPEAER